MSGISIDSKELAGGWVSLAIGGEIDLATVEQLQTAIDQVFDVGSASLAVDLRGSSFMDSTGLKTLVMASRRFDEASREFAIVVSGGPVSRLIDLSGVNSSIRTVSDSDELTAENA